MTDKYYPVVDSGIYDLDRMADADMQLSTNNDPRLPRAFSSTSYRYFVQKPVLELEIGDLIFAISNDVFVATDFIVAQKGGLAGQMGMKSVRRKSQNDT